MGKLTISHLCVSVSCRVPQKWPDRRLLGGLVAAKLDQTGEKPMRVGSRRMGNLFQHPKSWSPASMGIWNSRAGGLGLGTGSLGNQDCETCLTNHPNPVWWTPVQLPEVPSYQYPGEYGRPLRTQRCKCLFSYPSAVTGRYESTVVTSDEKTSGCQQLLSMRTAEKKPSDCII
jgi:hypothetical protein